MDKAPQIYTIDATGRPLGRVASQAAAALRGKSLVDFEHYRVSATRVKIVNAARVKLTGKKLSGKLYRHYSGYPSGLKSEAAEKFIARRGYGEVCRRAIKGMLPNNKLRACLLKNLTIEN